MMEVEFDEFFQSVLVTFLHHFVAQQVTAP